MPIKTVDIHGASITLELPDPDEMLEEAIRQEEAGISGWDPYWGLLWAAAPETANLMTFRPSGAVTALELGCGIGLTGIAAMHSGLKVAFSDQSAVAVEMARSNAGRNGFGETEGLVFDWSSPPDRTFDFVFGSDILYDKSGHEPLLKTLRRTLAPGGVAWIGDAGRANAPLFLDLALRSGWIAELRDRHFNPASSFPHLQFRLLILRPQI